MPRFTLLMLAVLLLTPVAAAEEPAEVNPGDTAMWIKDLPKAFARAKEKDRILMICVNAKFVQGGKREEPAAKGLRENVYLDVRFVKKSREFVCAYLTRDGDSGDFGELRALGIEGHIVSPQHIFVSPDGERVLAREEYWSYGSGDTAVTTLIGLMEKAQRANTVEADPAPEGPDAADPGETMPEALAPDAQHAQERAEWIERMLKQVRQGHEEQRRTALDSLVTSDEAGDCIDPLIAILDEKHKDVTVLGDVIRALGRDGLEKAALPIADHLGHKEDLVRGYAAVSLEYIGSSEKKVVSELKKRVSKEKNEAIANHMYRAIGRCAAGDAKARALLLKKSEAAKSEFGSLGPIIGLAYFVEDEKAMRGVEKMIKKLGTPGGRRGSTRNALKRGVLFWTLSEIGDTKSGKFIREDMIPPLENMQAFWVEATATYYDAVARACEGEDGAKDEVKEGIQGIMSFLEGRGGGKGGGGRGGRGRRGGSGSAGAMPSLMDEYRKDRDTTEFEPKGDFIAGGSDS